MTLIRRASLSSPVSELAGHLRDPLTDFGAPSHWKDGIRIMDESGECRQIWPKFGSALSAHEATSRSHQLEAQLAGKDRGVPTSGQSSSARLEFARLAGQRFIEGDFFIRKSSALERMKAI